MKQVLLNAPKSVKMFVSGNFWLQIGLLLVAWWACQSIVNATRFPLPGGVVGLLLLLLALLNGWVSPVWIKGGAKYLIDHLALFFLPAMVAFISHSEYFGWLGVKLIIAVLMGTLSVMIGTALAVDFGFMVLQRRKRVAVTVPPSIRGFEN